MGAEPDFSGWATKVGIKCSDGRTITAEAFKHMDGQTVPLVWQHGHHSPDNILGKVVLEHMEGEGVYAHAYFNDSPQGQQSKLLVQHGDIKNLSIYANKLVEKTKQVFHGMIREVSLVLSGANPGAVIENVAIAHGDGFEPEIVEDAAVIYTGLELQHSDSVEHAEVDEESDETLEDVIATMTDKQREVLTYMIGEALQQSDGNSDGEDTIEHAAQTVKSVYDAMNDLQKKVVHLMIDDAVNGDAEHSDSESDSLEHADDETVADVYNAFTDIQKQAVRMLIDGAMKEAGVSHSDEDESDNRISHTEEGDTAIMGHNVFEKDATTGGTLSHDDLQSIVGFAKKNGSLKEAFENFIEHADPTYGIGDIDVLFPDAKLIVEGPELISRRMEWVNAVLQGTKKSPLSRIKTMSADITHEQARAKGYVKGSLKKEEWFKLAKRITTPTTIYKKQKLDRDDIIDIVDLDVVAWLKGEMRLMLDEEIARAILLGDGREVDDDDKIDENCIRPIAHDDDFYTHRVVLPAATGGDALVEAFLRARPKYRGSGLPTLFLTEDLLTDLLLGRDKMGRRFYESQDVLKTALRVRDIQTVDAMEDVSTNGGDLLAVMVNLADYTVGADRGGNVSMFDDFDIDYNQYKYLIETRMSGALTKFKSAQAFVRSAGTLVAAGVPTFNTTTGVLTIPSTTGVVYRNGDTGVAFASGAQPAIGAGQSVEVVAEPDNGYYFEHNTDNDWVFTRNA